MTTSTAPEASGFPELPKHLEAYFYELNYLERYVEQGDLSLFHASQALLDYERLHPGVREAYSAWELETGEDQINTLP